MYTHINYNKNSNTEKKFKNLDFSFYKLVKSGHLPRVATPVIAKLELWNQGPCLHLRITRTYQLTTAKIIGNKIK